MSTHTTSLACRALGSALGAIASSSASTDCSSTRRSSTAAGATASRCASRNSGRLRSSASCSTRWTTGCSSATGRRRAAWALTVSYRADTAADVNGGACPGIGCNTGSGFSAGIQGALVPGIDLVVEAASYTQSGDIARWYYEPSLTLDLQQLLRLPAQPVFRIWYKNFDPYTAPLDAPLGHLLTPDEFGVFNINDNLTGLGGRLDVAVTPSLGLFGLAEWGTYKDGGPNYTVYSVGIKYSLTTDILIKLSYNSYQVDGGTVTTSPISGLQLANAQMYELELTKSF